MTSDDDDTGVGGTSTSSSTLHIDSTSPSRLITNRSSNHRPHLHASSMSAPAAAVATMPVMPFPAGAFPGGFCGLTPTQLAPLQMYPPYIFMGFPLHPQLLQSYPVATADPPPTRQPVNPGKRKLTHPMRAPRDEKLYRASDAASTASNLHSVGHVTYLPIVTSPPMHDDRKQIAMTSPGSRGSTDSHQGAGEFDQDGALDLTKK